MEQKEQTNIGKMKLIDLLHVAGSVASVIAFIFLLGEGFGDDMFIRRFMDVLIQALYFISIIAVAIYTTWRIYIKRIRPRAKAADKLLHIVFWPSAALVWVVVLTIVTLLLFAGWSWLYDLIWTRFF